MVRRGDRELPKLRGMGDHLKANVVKPSQIADELSCLVVPTDDANCGLLNFLSHLERMSYLSCYDSSFLYGGGR